VFPVESKSYVELSERLEALSRIEQLSVAMHSRADEHRQVALMFAYCDESGDQRIFAVCGLMGRLAEWREVGRLWRVELLAAKLDAFHAAHCEARRGAFEAMERDQRDHLQRRFYQIVAQHNLWGYCHGAFLQAFEANKELLAKYQREKPYYLMFQTLIERMALDMDAAGLPKTEQITFIFDQQVQFQPIAGRIYQNLASGRATKITYSHRLRGLAFISDDGVPELQAADVWAYESRKYLSDVIVNHRPDDRWQYKLLKDSGRMRIDGCTADSVMRLAHQLGWSLS